MLPLTAIVACHSCHVSFKYCGDCEPCQSKTFTAKRMASNLQVRGSSHSFIMCRPHSSILNQASEKLSMHIHGISTVNLKQSCGVVVDS